MKLTKGAHMGAGLGTPHRRDKRREYDAKRQGRADRSWYKSARWQAKRRNQLRNEPYCRFHVREHGRKVWASVVDHVKPHNGDWALFWHGELQSLCKPCHDSRKQGDERRGFSTAVDAEGWPTDPKHPANGTAPGFRCEEG